MTFRVFSLNNYLLTTLNNLYTAWSLVGSHKIFKIRSSLKKGALVWDKHNYKKDMAVAVTDTWIRCYGGPEEGKPRKQVV